MLAVFVNRGNEKAASVDETTKKRAASRKWLNVAVGVSAALVVPVVVAAAVAAPKVFTSGTAISSADVNANFDGMEKRLAALEAAAVAGPTSGLRVVQKGSFALPNGVHTLIDYSSTGVVYDLGGEFDSAADVFRAKTAGMYAVSCGSGVRVVPAGLYLAATILVNGAQYTEHGALHEAAPYAITRVAATVLVKAGDTIGCAAYREGFSGAITLWGSADHVQGFMVAKL